MTARAAAASAEPAPRPRVVVYTTEEIVLPEAEKVLAPSFETIFFRSWPDVIPALELMRPEALLLDLDTVGTASNDGLRALQQVRQVDPDIAVQDAYAQAPRISAATGIPEAAIREIVDQRTDWLSTVLGEPYVNVLDLNIALMQAYPHAYPGLG